MSDQLQGLLSMHVLLRGEKGVRVTFMLLESADVIY